MTLARFLRIAQIATITLAVLIGAALLFLDF